MKKIKLSKWCGGFGNNLIQLSNAISYCLKNNYVFESPEHQFINCFFINNHIKYDVVDSSQNFFNYFDYQNRYLYVKKFIRPSLKDSILSKIKNIDNSTVVVQIRSGDIFSNIKIKSKEKYVQNPLSYFKNIISQYEKAIIVSENKNNPVIDYLLDLPNTKLQMDGLENDIATILSAKNLCLGGFGTFGIGCCMLSNNIEKLHITNLVSNKYFDPSIIVDFKYIDLNKYIKIGEWKNTDDQIKIMIEYNLQ